MVTDGVPKTARLQAEYVRSDETRGLELHGDDRFVQAARCIEDALVTEEAPPVRRACVEFLRLAAQYYRVSMPQVRVLRARCDGESKHVTSFGTFFATLCHE